MRETADSPVLRVLLVDTENNSRESITSELSALGAKVTSFSEFGCAESLVRQGAYDLVLADVCSTGISGLEGLELIPYVKTHCPQARVIVMDEDDSRPMMEKAFRLGAEYFIRKPFDASVIGFIIGALGLMGGQG